MTWNIEGIKTNLFALSDLLYRNRPDLVFLSEPLIFQHDLESVMKYLKNYKASLTSNDLFDPDLAIIKSKPIGGTMVLWHNSIDPFVTPQPSPTSAISVIALNVPGCRTSIHLAIYMPTSGKDSEFINEITNLRNLIDEINDKYDNPLIFIRGDGNSNKNNTLRCRLFQSLLNELNLQMVDVPHNTYHHFTGNGKYDSNIDILAHSSNVPVSTESVVKIMCKFENPEFKSHHDPIFSSFTLAQAPVLQPTKDLITAPRTSVTRQRILWSEEGVEKYRAIVSSMLPEVCQRWSVPESESSTAILLQCTNSLLNMAATMCNKSTYRKKAPQSQGNGRCPKSICKAKNALQKAHKKIRSVSFLPQNDPYKIAMQEAFKVAKKTYHSTVRAEKRKQDTDRDTRLFSILTDNPQKVYEFIKSNRRGSASQVQHLSVGDKIYVGNTVADGFYDSLTKLKTCDFEELVQDPKMNQALNNYDHIIKLSSDLNMPSIPPINTHVALDLLNTLKKNVADIYGTTTLHYLYAGDAGIEHFARLINCIITNINNASIKEINTAYGLILYKGHGKDKTSDRSYRTISTCPLIAKAIDLYLNRLYSSSWHHQTASTQFMAPGCSHELASLLITEICQYSLYVLDSPVYLLLLDAQSAYDRCLRQILCMELFNAGTIGSPLLLIDKRLAHRSTIYEWNGEMLGPAEDDTGFEQGGINSGEFYKLYNNEQLNTADKSQLGVDIGSTIVSAVGAADDVILISNDITKLSYLARLTEIYCSNYRVKLVPSKTKLLPVFSKKHSEIIEYSRLINPIKIAGEKVEFVEQANHVGVTRCSTNNLTNIHQRITAHKKSLAAVTSAGLARGHKSNPAASLRVHQLYAVPVLFSGLASLVLNKKEKDILEKHYKDTIQNLQKLHAGTPRSVVYLLAGTLPSEAILHRKQLGLFSMICRLPNNPLNKHAKFILTQVSASARSWFHIIRDLCLQYNLPHPLTLLECPPTKEAFKKEVKLRITEYWLHILQSEAASMKSLVYFDPYVHSLSSPSMIWLSAQSTPIETSKAVIVSRIASGRYRCEAFCRHWTNSNGNCLSPTCDNVLGDVEHILLSCPALDNVRAQMFQMWQAKTQDLYPDLSNIISKILKSSSASLMQLMMSPFSVPEIIALSQSQGREVLDHVCYLMRTFVYYLHKNKQKIIVDAQTSSQHGKNVPTLT